MPPKPKFTREEIAAAALKVISRNGTDALTAHALGQELGSSARPIFTVFKNMEEVHQAVRSAALQHFLKFAEKAVHDTPLYKQVGMQVILFALEEPYLYQLLFMKGARSCGFEELLARFREPAGLCIGSLQKDYDLSEEDAMALFRHVLIYAYGVSSLCATGICGFSEEEVNDLLGQDFMAMLFRIKSGGLIQQTSYPIPNGR